MCGSRYATRQQVLKELNPPVLAASGGEYPPEKMNQMAYDECWSVAGENRALRYQPVRCKNPMTEVNRTPNP